MGLRKAVGVFKYVSAVSCMGIVRDPVTPIV